MRRCRRRTFGAGTATAACLLALLPATPAQAVVTANGWGIANHIEDPRAQQSRHFDELTPASFRFVAEWESLDEGAYRKKVRTVIDEANAGARGTGQPMEIAVSFSCPRPHAAGRPPSAGDWIAPVGRFIDRFTGDVEWWGTVNEPNHSTCVLGAEIAASYSKKLYGYLATRRYGDRLMSPDFHDEYAGSSLAMSGARSTVAGYVGRFRAAGGKFGSAVAWHPYGGIERRSMLSTNDLAATLDESRETASLPIWATEAGALIFLKNASGRVIHRNTPDLQNDRVAFICDVLAHHAKVTRISYYNMRYDGNPSWDSALVGARGVRRPAWYTWSRAAGTRSDTESGMDGRYWDVLRNPWMDVALGEPGR